MAYSEYLQTKRVFLKSELLARQELMNRSLRSTKALADYFESLIAIEGHAWCMDVRNERQKMARLLVKGLMSLQTQTTN